MYVFAFYIVYEYISIPIKYIYLLSNIDHIFITSTKIL